MIIPAIIPKSLVDLEATIKSVGFAKIIQIDVVDGKFVPFISWPYETEENVNEAKFALDGYEVEVDLMVEDPLNAAEEWLSIGARRIIFHLESLNDIQQAINLVHSKNAEVYLALNNDTNLERIYGVINNIDGVQLMGIAEIGTQGQPFDSRVLERIATLRALFPDLLISVDGGVSKETIAELKKAGAKHFVSGSAILKADEPRAAYQELLKIIASD